MSRAWTIAVLVILAGCEAPTPADTTAADEVLVVAPTPAGSAPCATDALAGDYFDPALEVARPAGRHIDAHSHLINPSAWPEIERVMNENQIDYYFNMSGGSPRDGMTAALALQEASGDRILNFMNVDWEGIDEVAFGDVLAEELELCVTRYGYAGLKISKALGLFARDGYGQLIAVNDPRLFPLWERAGELGVPVYIHTSDPLAFWSPVTPENERYAELSAHPGWSFADPEFPSREELLAQRDDLLRRFPDTRFVGVHFANNPEDLDYVEHALETYPNLWLDIAARVPEIGRHDPERVRAIFERFGDRIMFATDIVIAAGRGGRYFYQLGSVGDEPDTGDRVTPFYEAHWRYLETHDEDIAHPTPIQGDWTVDAVGLSAEQLDALYYENAYRLVVAPWLARNAARDAAGE